VLILEKGIFEILGIMSVKSSMSFLNKFYHTLSPIEMEIFFDAAAEPWQLGSQDAARPVLDDPLFFISLSLVLGGLWIHWKRDPITKELFHTRGKEYRNVFHFYLHYMAFFEPSRSRVRRSQGFFVWCRGFHSTSARSRRGPSYYSLRSSSSGHSGITAAFAVRCPEEG